MQLENQPGLPKTDAVQKQFLKHGGLVLLLLVILFVGRAYIPRLPFLRGWESRLTTEAASMGKDPLPENAISLSSKDEVMSKFPILAQYSEALDLNGPLPVGAWPCQVNKDHGTCVRYLYQNEPLTLFVMPTPKRVRVSKGPFTKAGYSGLFVIQPPNALVLVGPFTPNELLELWPWATKQGIKPATN
jgi:hypothetical protein